MNTQLTNKLERIAKIQTSLGIVVLNDYDYYKSTIDRLNGSEREEIEKALLKAERIQRWWKPIQKAEQNQLVALPRFKDYVSFAKVKQQLLGNNKTITDDDIKSCLAKTKFAPVTVVDSLDKAIEFQCIDIKQRYKNQLPYLLEYLCFGRQQDGSSVCVRVHGFQSHFYVKCPADFASDIQKSKRKLENSFNFAINKDLQNTYRRCHAFECVCKERNEKSKKDPEQLCLTKQRTLIKRGEATVTNMRFSQGKTILGYHKENQLFLNVSVSHPFLIPIVSKVFYWKNFGEHRFQLHEDNIDPIMRFMSDLDIVGCGWIKATKVKNNKASNPLERLTRCDLEVKVPVSNIRSDLSNGGVTPIRTLGLDIECMSLDVNKFPTADKCPVIQMSAVTQKLGVPKPERKVVFCLKECAPIPEGEIEWFETEAELLYRIFKYIVEFDPDIITGYNSNKFDLPYLFERAETLGLDCFKYMSKIMLHPVTYEKKKTTSNQKGTVETMLFNFPGRITLDVFELIKAGQDKLRSYSLDFVSQHYLKNEKKDDLKYSDIPEYQNRSPETRAVIAKYCLQDTMLVMLLIDKLQLLVNNVEFARVLGVRLSDVFERGISFKLLRKLLQYTKKQRFYIPSFKKDVDGVPIIPFYEEMVHDAPDVQEKTKKEQRKQSLLTKYFKQGSTLTSAKQQKKQTRKRKSARQFEFEGATVVEPAAGYYEKFVVTLDFKSLYPSLMIFYNLSYDTMLKSEEYAVKQGLKKDEYSKTPSGFLFVHKNVYKGILCSIEEELLAARTKAKKQMKAAKDPLEYSVLDGKQMALKLCCNALFGFTGARQGHLSGIPISSSVTAFGRKSLEDAQQWVHKHFPQDFQNVNARGTATVIYGDSDSIFVEFSDAKSVEEATMWGKECATRINGPEGLFQQPMELEYEKCYERYLLLKKKKYAGFKYEGNKLPKLDAKGIEMVRRDNALLCSETQKTFLDLLLVQNEKTKAINFVRETIQKLLTRQVPLEKLVITKKLSKTEYKAKPPHLMVWNKLTKREPATAPKLGDRIPFVIVYGSADKVAERAEDPEYVQKHNLRIDVEHYLKTQLKQPMERLLIPIIGQKESDRLFNANTYRKVIYLSGGIVEHMSKGKQSTNKKYKTITPLQPQEQHGNGNKRAKLEQTQLNRFFN